MKVTLISTVYQEADNILEFLGSLAAQTRLPDEIIITDAGSTDGTPDLIRSFGGLPVTVVDTPGANRSRGRNEAIGRAAHPVVACTDAGCRLDQRWLERIVAPFESADPPDVVAGYYQPDPRTLFEAAVAAATVPAAAEVNPDTFLPSGRSVAMTKAAWEKVGGYPEWTVLSEDTIFDLALREAGCRFAFVPEAVACWRPQGSMGRVWRQFYRYAKSDGERGLWFGHYGKAYLWCLVALTSLAGAVTAWPELWWPAWLAPWAVYDLRYSARARRRGAGLAASELAPFVNLLVDAAHAVGYTAGRLRRLRRGGDAHE